jgi:chemotaxis protein CheX
MVTGRVFINGAWRGTIEVECSRPLALRAAASMLGSGVDDVSSKDLKDALGELTNIIGGNIKSLLPGPSHLSLPAVWEGSAAAARPSYERLLDRATLKCGDQPVRISIWHNTAPTEG